jgi:hypothetical protein
MVFIGQWYHRRLVQSGVAGRGSMDETRNLSGIDAGNLSVTHT